MPGYKVACYLLIIYRFLKGSGRSRCLIQKLLSLSTWPDVLFAEPSTLRENYANCILKHFLRCLFFWIEDILFSLLWSMCFDFFLLSLSSLLYFSFHLLKYVPPQEYIQWNVNNFTLFVCRQPWLPSSNKYLFMDSLILKNILEEIIYMKVGWFAVVFMYTLFLLFLVR